MPAPFSHCHFCGAPYEHETWPRRCAVCGQLTFSNPTPVAVALTPVAGTGGLLLVRRAIPPTGPALPGGFVDSADADWQAGCAREVREETGLEVTVERLFDVRSTPNGRQLLLFAVTTPVTEAEVAAVVASDETDGASIGTRAELGAIVFPLHREVAERWLDGAA